MLLDVGQSDMGVYVGVAATNVDVVDDAVIVAGVTDDEFLAKY